MNPIPLLSVVLLYSRVLITKYYVFLVLCSLSSYPLGSSYVYRMYLDCSEVLQIQVCCLGCLDK